MIYDEDGRPLAYANDGEMVYLLSGEPIGYFYSNSLYSLSGRFIGLYENGLIKGLNGNNIFFMNDQKKTIKPQKIIRIKKQK